MFPKICHQDIDILGILKLIENLRNSALLLRMKFTLQEINLRGTKITSCFNIKIILKIRMIPLMEQWTHFKSLLTLGHQSKTNRNMKPATHVSLNTKGSSLKTMCSCLNSNLLKRF